MACTAGPGSPDSWQGSSQKAHPPGGNPGIGLDPELALVFPRQPPPPAEWQPPFISHTQSLCRRGPDTVTHFGLLGSFSHTNHQSVPDHGNYDQTPACHETELRDLRQLTLERWACSSWLRGPSACKRNSASTCHDVF